MHANESSGHGRIAGQEERSALLQHADEPVTDGVAVEVRPIVAHTYHHRRWLITCRYRPVESNSKQLLRVFHLFHLLLTFMKKIAMI